ncbi:MAG: hypothetical protein J3K34DRAFT_505074 [Monoraphidium minutum]|nr:MAG: hypothetical protein J3K34DRAFT_505074 [Monoraphidium minutum]
MRLLVLALLLAGGQARGIVCSKPPGYTGQMVLPTGAKEPDLCTPEFPGDGARSYLEYDYIPMAAAALTREPAAASVEACQARCAAAGGAAAGCVYFVFDATAAAGRRCSLRLTGVAPAAMADAAQPKVLFELLSNRFSAYAAAPSDWASLGRDLAAYPSLRAALEACGSQAACIGAKYDPRGGARPWKAFGGALREGVVGKVRTTGPSINPWAKY